MSETEHSRLLSPCTPPAGRVRRGAPWLQVTPDNNTRTISTSDMSAILAEHPAVGLVAQPLSGAQQTLVFLGPSRTETTPTSSPVAAACCRRRCRCWRPRLTA